ALVAMADDAQAGRDWQPAWSALRERHLQAAESIAPGNGMLRDAVATDFDGLRGDLDALSHGEGGAAHLLARAHGLGEIASSRLVQAALGDGWERLDARDVLVVHPGEMGVGVDWEASRAKLTAWHAAHPASRIV